PVSHLRSMPHHAVTETLTLATQDVVAQSVNDAIKAARAAQTAWGTRSPADRALVLRRFRRVLYRRRHEVAALVTAESGKPLTDALGVDVSASLDFAAWTARTAPRFLRGHWRRASGLLFWRKRVRIDHRPIGVIAVIAPWNYPFFLPAACVLPALACGNAVVL